MNLPAFWYRRYHVSYTITCVAIGTIAGLVIGRHVAISLSAPLMFIGLVLLLGAAKSGRWWALGAATVAGLIFGMIRGSVVQQAYDTYTPLFSRVIEITGTMTSDAKTGATGQQQLVLGHIIVDGRHYEGEVYVTTFSKQTLKRGDEITVAGKLREGFAAYGAALSSGKIVTLSRAPNVIRDIRERFGQTVRKLMAEPMASLGLGFVVGQRSALPDTLDEQLKIVGLTHIVVASGYNLTILVRFVMRVLAKYSRYLALVGSLFVIMTFGLFSGFSPSMNRAVIVTVLGLLAWYVGRRFHPVQLVLYVAAATSLYDPMYVWSDLGWYLSFFAFIGILLLAPLLVSALYLREYPNAFLQLVIETLCAEIMALPLVAFTFSSFPVFGIVANILVGPFIPAAMALTALTGFIGMIVPVIGTFLALPTTILIAYMIAVVEWLAGVPWAQYGLEMNLLHMVIWYGALFAISYVIFRKRHYDFRARDNRLEV